MDIGKVIEVGDRPPAPLVIPPLRPDPVEPRPEPVRAPEREKEKV